jgi:hypothetical protein
MTWLLRLSALRNFFSCSESARMKEESLAQAGTGDSVFLIKLRAQDVISQSVVAKLPRSGYTLDVTTVTLLFG